MVGWTLTLTLAFAFCPEPELTSAEGRRPATIAQLADASAAVVFGEVLEKKHARDVRGVPWTLFVVQPLEVLLGSVDDSLMTVRCSGGPVEDGYVAANGTPQLERGERWLLFYNPDDQLCQLSGWEQGALIEVPLADGRRTLANGVGQTLLTRGPNAGRALGAAVDLRVVKPSTLVAIEATEIARTDATALMSTAQLLDDVRSVCALNNRRARSVRFDATVVGTFEFVPVGPPTGAKR